MYQFFVDIESMTEGGNWGHILIITFNLGQSQLKYNNQDVTPIIRCPFRDIKKLTPSKDICEQAKLKTDIICIW